MDFISNLSNLIEGILGQLVLGYGCPDLRTQMFLPEVTDGVSAAASFQFLLADIID